METDLYLPKRTGESSCRVSDRACTTGVCPSCYVLGVRMEMIMIDDGGSDRCRRNQSK